MDPPIIAAGKAAVSPSATCSSNATATEETAAAEPLAPAAPDIPADGEKPIAAESGKVGFGPDARELMTVTLGSSNADPKMRLLRSFKYRQMQISFDQEP
jgi:hypothetical protein